MMYVGGISPVPSPGKGWLRLFHGVNMCCAVLYCSLLSNHMHKSCSFTSCPTQAPCERLVNASRWCSVANVCGCTLTMFIFNFIVAFTQDRCLSYGCNRRVPSLYDCLQTTRQPHFLTRAEATQLHAPTVDWMVMGLTVLWQWKTWLDYPCLVTAPT